MKKLIVKNRTYQKLEKDFTKFLQSSGYSKSSQTYLPLHVREFLHWQESQKRVFEDWQSLDFIEFLDYLKTRQNQRKSGGLSAAYINKMSQALQLLQQYLKDSNQADFYLKIPKQGTLSTELEIFSREEIEELYAHCKSNLMGLRMRAILALCYGCGLRRGEAAGMNLEDIWWEKKLVQVVKAKNNKSRLVPMAKGVEADLRNYIDKGRPFLASDKPSSALFVGRDGERLNDQTLYISFKKLLKQAGMRLRGLHTLRHSIASHLADSGMKSEQVAQFLGHRSLDSTQIYVHAPKGDKKG